MALKYDILRQLEQNRDRDLSGEELARAAGVTRAAVWKAVTSLRHDGYRILSGTNKGYRLSADDDRLSPDAIRAYLPADTELDIRVFETLDSTNNEAKRLAVGGVTGPVLILAEEQTAGRGRLGRSFYSPAGTGLYLTLLYRTPDSLAKTVPVTSAAAVAVTEAIETLTEKRPGIKWVNDVYLDGKKICGILTEAVTDMESGDVQNVIIGIGLNVSTDAFPAELRERAASLFPVGVSRNRFAAGIASRLLHYAKELDKKTFLTSYRSHSILTGREITYRRGEVLHGGTVIGIGDDCGLMVRRPDGNVEVLRTGEVTVRLKED